MNGGGDGVRTDAANVLALYKDMERLRQRQEMLVKAEPSSRTDSEADDHAGMYRNIMKPNFGLWHLNARSYLCNCFCIA
jgi:hypothetical protein